MSSPPSRLASLEHPMVFGSFRAWMSLLSHSRGIQPRYLPRILLVCLSTLATSPLRWVERLLYDRAVAATPIHPEPVFIIGHWRSGTTHLHNLLAQDANLGYLTTFQAMAPGLCLVGDSWLRPLLGAIAHRIHPTRLIDNIPLLFDSPQEDEYAIANQSPFSHVHLFTFPQRAIELVERYAMFQGLPEGALLDWRQLYLGSLRKASFKAGGRRLVLKNPAHCGRLKEVLALFPEARFIHIYRNPYQVFQSMRFTYRAVLPYAQVQEIDAEQVDACILHTYTRLMRQFLADKSLIPPGNLIEVRFEDLETDPLGILKGIYQALRLPGFEQALPAFRAYLASVADYQKNRYEIDGKTVAVVNQHWDFALQAWGYPKV